MHKFQDKKNLHPFTRNSRSRSVFSFPVINFQRGDDPYPRLREFLSKVCEFIFLFLFRAVALPNIHSSLYLLFLRAVSKTASSRKESIVALASPTNLGSCWILNAWWNGNPSWNPKMRKGMAVNPGDEYQDQMANQKWIDWKDVTVVFGGQWGQRKRRSSWCQCIFSLEWQGHLEFGQLCSAPNVQGRELKWVKNVTAV